MHSVNKYLWVTVILYHNELFHRGIYNNSNSQTETLACNRGGFMTLNPLTFDTPDVCYLRR